MQNPQSRKRKPTQDPDDSETVKRRYEHISHKHSHVLDAGELISTLQALKLVGALEKISGGSDESHSDD